MKLLRTVILSLCAALLCAACGGDNSPAAVAEKYCKAIITADVETAVKYATPELAEKTKKSFSDDSSKKFVLKEYEGTKLKLLEVSFAADSLSAGVILYLEKLPGSNKGDEMQTFSMVMEDGEWKVSDML